MLMILGWNCYGYIWNGPVFGVRIENCVVCKQLVIINKIANIKFCRHWKRNFILIPTLDWTMSYGTATLYFRSIFNFVKFDIISNKHNWIIIYISHYIKMRISAFWFRLRLRLLIPKRHSRHRWHRISFLISQVCKHLVL